MKVITDSRRVKSYEAKYAVEMTFQINKKPSDIYGEALEKVMKYQNIRGLYDIYNVHPDLRELGVTEIVLQDNTVDFRGKK